VRKILQGVLTVLLGLVVFAGVCEAKKMFPVNISKGEMPNDAGSACSMALAEDNCGPGAELSLKLAFTAPSFAGEFNPKRGSWSAYKTMKFNIFSEADKKITMALGIKDDGSISNNEQRKTWIVLPFEVKPGMNDVSVSLEDLKAQDGRKADLKKVKQWFFSYKFFPETTWDEKTAGNELNVFISNLRLED